jgi:hypothetical protein
MALVHAGFSIADFGGDRWFVLWNDLDAKSTTASFASVLFVMLLVLWVAADSRDHPQIVRPFDYGLLLYIFWLPYLPYYLWRTRGPLGLLMFAGFLILLSLGWIVQIGMYLVRAA